MTGTGGHATGGIDLVVRDTRLADGSRVDIGVDRGLVTAVGTVPERGRTELDAAGGLASEAFVEPHFHLDKCLNTDSAPDLPDLPAYLEAEKADKRTRSAADVAARTEQALALLVQLGVRAVRAQVDVDTVAGLRGLEGVLAARERYQELVQDRGAGTR